jgi:hypothetical protein
LNPGVFGGFTPIIYLGWRIAFTYLMVCGITGNDEDHGRIWRPGAEGQEWSSIGRVLSGRTIERLGDTVCGLHRARGDEERGFLGLA